jgi:hypothetical protein
VPAEERHFESIGSWFADAWLDMFGRPSERQGLAAPDAAAWLASPGNGLEARLVLAESAPVGFIALRTNPNALTIAALAIAQPCRNLGLGADAVYAAEAICAPGAAARALLPLGNGLALYFWLRIGYHPLFASQHGLAGMSVVERRPVLNRAAAVQPGGR